MTYGEVIDNMRAYSNKRISDLKEKASMDYKLANLIAANVAGILSNDAKIPTLPEAYEFLFKEEKKTQDQIKIQTEMEIWKQRMIGFTENHNRKWGEKK